MPDRFARLLALRANSAASKSAHQVINILPELSV